MYISNKTFRKISYYNRRRMSNFMKGRLKSKNLSVRRKNAKFIALSSKNFLNY